MAPKIAIIFYSTWGHIRQLAEAEKAGIEKAGGTADLYQIPETLPADILTKMHAPPKPTDIPELSSPEILKDYDAFLMGVPTRYGSMPAQWRAFWDSTGQMWREGAYHGKMAGLFVTTALQGGGQEMTAMACLSTLAAHGVAFVPLGSAATFASLSSFEEIRGGSPWGAGSFAGADGMRRPSGMELGMAAVQGEEFYRTVAKFVGSQ